MSKVFSIEKFKNDSDITEDIQYSLETWALECDGLTKAQVEKLGYFINDDWMVEWEDF